MGKQEEDIWCSSNPDTRQFEPANADLFFSSFDISEDLLI